MSDLSFTLHVPADPDFRDVACEVVGRYLNLLGGSEADRAAFTVALAETVADLSGHSEGEIQLSCAALGSGCEVTLRCDGRSSVVRHPLSTGSR